MIFQLLRTRQTSCEWYLWRTIDLVLFLTRHIHQKQFLKQNIWFWNENIKITISFSSWGRFKHHESDLCEELLWEHQGRHTAASVSEQGEVDCAVGAGGVEGDGHIDGDGSGDCDINGDDVMVMAVMINCVGSHFNPPSHYHFSPSYWTFLAGTGEETIKLFVLMKSNMDS